MGTPTDLRPETETVLKKRGQWVALFFLLMEGLRILLGQLLRFLAASVPFLSSAWQVQESNGVYVPTNLGGFLLTSLVQRLIFLGIPLVVAWIFLKKKNERLPLWETPVAPHRFAIFTAVGLGVCVIGNLVTLLTGMFFQIFSIYPAPTVLPHDGSVGSLIGNILCSALVPAVLEELLCRGVAIKILRPAGKSTAIVVSALFFSVCHQTLNQIPFSFLLGLFLGFVYLQTDNILVPMLLHFLNNLMSVVITHLSFVPGASAGMVMNVTYVSLVVIGFIALLFIEPCVRIETPPLHPEGTVGERVKEVLSSGAVKFWFLISLISLICNLQIRLTGGS